MIEDFYNLGVRMLSLQKIPLSGSFPGTWRSDGVLMEMNPPLLGSL